MSGNIHKSHNVSKLMYHFVLPTKYRGVVVSDEVEKVIKETCLEISKRYDMYFLEKLQKIKEWEAEQERRNSKFPMCL